MSQEKLQMFRATRPWEEACAEWEKEQEKSALDTPLKRLSILPRMPGITKHTASWLKYKAIKYLLTHDKHRVFARYFFKHPLQYTWRWVKSALKKHSFERQGDFFLYGCKSIEAFIAEAQQDDTLVLLGFSYCHKPFECPSQRFSSDCIHDLQHPVCRQCFIGKCVHATYRQEGKFLPLFIPTIHYIGECVFKALEEHPLKRILFLITACELTLNMFGDWGNMVGVHGLGVRLDGRICNTMDAFRLSEEGVKPGLTVILPDTQHQLFQIIRAILNR